MLIEADADVNMVTQQGESALHSAASHCMLMLSTFFNSNIYKEVPASKNRQ